MSDDYPEEHCRECVFLEKIWSKSKVIICTVYGKVDDPNEGPCQTFEPRPGPRDIEQTAQDLPGRVGDDVR